MAQSGVLWVPRIQLIRGFDHTMITTDLSIGGQETLAQVSFTAGRSSRWKLIPAVVNTDSRPPSWPGSYGGFLVKRIVSDGTSFSGLSVGHIRRCVDHPGRPPWSDLSVCKLVSGGTRCSVPCCPIRGAGGVWRAGPILTAAYLSHSPVRCTAHPDGCQASGGDHRLPAARSVS